MSQSYPATRVAGLKPPWQPGQTANTVGAKGFRRVLAMARKGSPEAVQTVLDCMRDPNAPWPSRLTAATWIVERAWGKSESRLHLDGADGANIMIVTGVPDPDSVAQAADMLADETFTIEYDAPDAEEEAT